MLPPEYLRDLPERILALYDTAEESILRDMARRIAAYNYWIPAADHQAARLLEAGRTQEEILQTLSGLTGRTQEELKRMMQEAGARSLRSDAAIYRNAGMTVPDEPSGTLRRLLNAGYRATLGEMKNLCRTTARTATKQFEDALDLAWLQVQSGAFDVDAAIRNAIGGLAERGISAIRYASGRTDSIEVAVRRAAVTGVNQTCCRMQEELADEVGCDLVEVSAHAGARPEHALWQGKIYSLSGTSDKYPDFRTATGYGTGAGLGGWNCRHGFSPWVEGAPRVYSDEALAEMEAPKYEYNGKQLTEYEAQQQQRAYEREIRRRKREYVALDAAGLDTSEAAVKLRTARERQADFLRKTGLTRQYDREQNGVANPNKRGIMKPRGGNVFIESINKPIEQRNTGKGKPSAIMHFDVDLNNRQQSILDTLPEYNSRVIISKNDVNMTDLAALTAKTGDEFALFTKEGNRLVVRGNQTMVEISQEEAHTMGCEGYVWSGHTHPGTGMNVLQPSDGDYAILNQFNQKSSVIYNSAGQYLIFERTEPYV